jgi:hypothetical protein
VGAGKIGSHGYITSGVIITPLMVIIHYSMKESVENFMKLHVAPKTERTFFYVCNRKLCDPVRPLAEILPV